jgi:hypothetical protein
MRKVFTILAAVLLTATVWAQSPEKMSYQAVVRNASDALVKNSEVGMRVQILQASEFGAAVYVETQSPTSNANGLVSVSIGGGTVVSGTFADIDWANGPYFIKTEIDPAGGTSYSITSTSQLLSVPYALHAKTAETVTGAITETDPVYAASQAKNITAAHLTKLAGIADGAEVNVQADWNQATNTADDYIKNKPTIPAAADGSETKVTAGTNVTVTGSGTTASPYVVSATMPSPTYTVGFNFNLGGYVFFVTPDGKHGLVAEADDQSAGCSWYDAQNIISNPNNLSLSGKKFTDWRMPTKHELNLMYLAKIKIGGFADDYYWSSTEYSSIYAWMQGFDFGFQDYGLKDGTGRVRAVRAF